MGPVFSRDPPVDRATRPASLLTITVALWTTRAAAGPPYATDDPQPTDFEHVDAYLASQSQHATDGWSGTAPHVEVNYGLLPDVHLHLLAPLAYAKPEGGKLAYGYGDTELGLKYRFLHEGPVLPTIGTYVLVEAPTGSSANGLGNGAAQIFVPTWLLKHFGAWQTYGGGGIWYDFGRERAWAFLGWQVQRRIVPELTVGAEVTYQSPPAPGVQSDARFNLGAVLDLSDAHHLMASAGRGFYGLCVFQAYVGYLLTFGPGQSEDQGVRAPAP
jgi:hypothetical protein